MNYKDFLREIEKDIKAYRKIEGETEQLLASQEAYEQIFDGKEVSSSRIMEVRNDLISLQTKLQSLHGINIGLVKLAYLLQHYIQDENNQPRLPESIELELDRIGEFSSDCKRTRFHALAGKITKLEILLEAC